MGTYTPIVSFDYILYPLLINFEYLSIKKTQSLILSCLAKFLLTYAHNLGRFQLLQGAHSSVFATYIKSLLYSVLIDHIWFFSIFHCKCNRILIIPFRMWYTYYYCPYGYFLRTLMRLATNIIVSWEIFTVS